MSGSSAHHIPHLKTISDFYRQLRIGLPQGDDFAIMRIEDQPDSKRQEMPLFRCNFFRVVFFTNAGVAFRLGEERFDSSANSIYYSYPGKLESWYTSRKIEGYLICFTQSFVNAGQQHKSVLEQEFPFFDFNAISLLRLNENQAPIVSGIAETMIKEMNSAYPDRLDMIRLLLRQYLLQLRRCYLAQIKTQNQSIRNDLMIYNQFRRALDSHFTELASDQVHTQASVSLLAEAVNLNASYLNTTIKNLTGKTASSHIQEKTLLEIKSYLMHTSLQAAEISHKLGFTNVSYFNRFFKKLTGITPLAFRGSST